MLSTFTAVVATVALRTLSHLAASPSPVLATSTLGDPKTFVYLGSGCFWESQYAYVNIEQGDAFSSRSYKQITALVGYAGSTRKGKDGSVCYHQPDLSSDYSLLGHTEVVQVALDGPSKKDQFRALVREYFRGFTGPKGARQRLDPGDQGSQYRSCIGMPGGAGSELYGIVVEENRPYEMDLETGIGEEPDVFNKVWIYDSDRLPFFRGEQYHQFHKDFHPGGDYGGWYRGCVRAAQIRMGRIPPSSCHESWEVDSLVVPCKARDDVVTEGQPLCRRGRGTGDFLPHDRLRWGVAPELRVGMTAHTVCCGNHRFAEFSGYWLENPQYFEAAKAATPENPLVHFDSVCGVPLFVAPVGRTAQEWLAESTNHGWPSFRIEETFLENVVIAESGEVQSVCGTHLGHNIPDARGDRYCIDLVCIAGAGATNTSQDFVQGVQYRSDGALGEIVHLGRLVVFVLVCVAVAMLLFGCFMWRRSRNLKHWAPHSDYVEAGKPSE